MRIVILFSLALSACAATAVGGSDIGGGEWRATDVNGVPVVGATPLTLRFEAGGRASGSGGCNSFGADYRRRSDSRLEFGPIVATEMACEAAVTEQEARYFAILDAAESFSRYGDGSLSIIAPDGRAVRFRRR